MKHHIFHDFYGCEAHIWEQDDGTANLVIYSGHSCHAVMIHDKFYNSFRGARIALGIFSDGTAKELKGVN